MILADRASEQDSPNFHALRLPVPRHLLGFNLMHVGQYDEAPADYTVLAAMPGSQYDCLNEMGWRYFRKRMHDPRIEVEQG